MASCEASVFAAQIDLRLDLQYDGAQAGAAGSWRLFARSDEQGIFSLNVRLADIGTPTNELPRGTVNGSDPAGFSVFFSNPVGGGVRELFAAQQTLNQSANEQGLFYGVGTLDNGSPQFPGAPGGTNSIGPNIASLTAVQGVPWANDDPLWATGVTVASGAFSAGLAPSFAGSSSGQSGQLFTNIGNSLLPGDRTDSIAFTTLVTSNLGFGVANGDYNLDGVVDAADYTVWRDTLGQSVAVSTGADGDGDGQITASDYSVWQSNFGSSSGSATAVPEPASGLLFSGFFATLLLRVRTRNSTVATCNLFLRKKPGNLSRLLDTLRGNIHTTSAA